MSDITEAGKALFSVIWPRREAFETGQFYSQRVVSALLVLYAAGGLTVHLAWAFGLVTILGTSGADYAKAADLTPLRNQTAQLSARLEQRSNDIMGVVIGGQIFDLQFKRCAASKGGSPDLVRAYSDQLQGSLDQYYQITGRGYSLQACP